MIPLAQNNIRRYTVLLLIILFFLIGKIHGQTNTGYSEEIEKKIKEVENNLQGPVQTQNSNVKWSLEERMKFYNANGVCIAMMTLSQSLHQLC